MAEPLATSRRREIGSGRRGPGQAASARSLLLTVLGEFVHPRRTPVWTSTLVEALATVGVEEKSSRQALARTASEGLLTSTRHGRRVRWQLSSTGADLLEEGTRRIYGFMREPHPWDGCWLVLSVPIPETQRRLRHQLRTRLTWLGLGSPTPGLWVTPDSGKAPEVHDVVRELGLETRAFAWSGPTTGIGDEARLLADAWALSDVAQRYAEFLDAFASRGAGTPRDAFVAQVEMVQAWRGFPFLDPDLPRELLHRDWPGPAAADTFHQRHDAWDRPAQAEWERLEGCC